MICSCIVILTRKIVKKRDGMLISDKENGTKLYEDGMPIAEIMVIPDMQ